MYTLEEIKDALVLEFDEIALLELLQVDSRLLVDRFSDIIERDEEKFLRMFEPTEDDLPEEEDNPTQAG